MTANAANTPEQDVAQSGEIDQELVDQLLAQTEGQELLGDGGVLQQLTKQVLETALDVELTDHLGYERGDPAGRGSGNSRNGASAKRVHTDVGTVEVAVPRDRLGSFEPAIVPKGSRRLEGFNERIIALYARGMTVRDIQAHLAEIYDVDVSADLISKVTAAVLEEAKAWQSRHLEPVYPVIYLDAITCKVRDQGVVTRKSAYLAVGIDPEGFKDVLGIWIDQAEGAKLWLRICNELANRGVNDVIFVCVDGLKGLPEAIESVWPNAIVQTSLVHDPRARVPTRHPCRRERASSDRPMRGPDADLSLPSATGPTIAIRSRAASAVTSAGGACRTGEPIRQEHYHDAPCRPRLGRPTSSACHRRRPWPATDQQPVRP